MNARIVADRQTRLGALLWSVVWALFPILVAIGGALLRSLVRNDRAFSR